MTFPSPLFFRVLDRPERGDRDGGDRQGVRGRGHRGRARLHGGGGRGGRRHQAQAHARGRPEAAGERQGPHAKDQEEVPLHIGAELLRQV